jgi:hypothetical protein
VLSERQKGIFAIHLFFNLEGVVNWLMDLGSQRMMKMGCSFTGLNSV